MIGTPTVKVRDGAAWSAEDSLIGRKRWRERKKERKRERRRSQEGRGGTERKEQITGTQVSATLRRNN